MAGPISSLLVVALLPIPAAAATLCVKPGGGNNCHPTISLAITTAQSGDTIRVAQGTYAEFVRLDKSVVLEGGWDLTFTTRAPSVYVSTIQPPPSPPSQLSVVRIEGPAAPTLDGFTITGGRADLDSNHGGGVSIRFGSNAVLRGNVITGNSAFLLGGGVWVQTGAVRLERNRIENNTAVGDGSVGGGVNIENAPATLTSNVIAGNHLTGVNWVRDLPEPSLVADIRNVVEGDRSPDGKGSLSICRGIEVGHIFQLRTKYADSKPR